MKITICGSTAFITEMEELAAALKKLHHEVKLPPAKFTDGSGKLWLTSDYYKFKKSSPFTDAEFLKNHTQRIRDHFDKVQWSEAILVTNWDKNGVAGYIGPNTLMEMGLALHLNKKIFLLKPVPDVPWKEEVVGLRPVVIYEDLNKITADDL